MGGAYLMLMKLFTRTNFQYARNTEKYQVATGSDTSDWIVSTDYQIWWGTTTCKLTGLSICMVGVYCTSTRNLVDSSQGKARHGKRTTPLYILYFNLILYSEEKMEKSGGWGDGVR